MFTTAILPRSFTSAGDSVRPFDFDGTLAHFTGDYALLVDSFRAELNLGDCKVVLG